jgi:hypothetical protein
MTSSRRPARPLVPGFWRVPALQRGEQRAGEQVEDHHGGQRVARDPDHGHRLAGLPGPGVAEQRGVTGPDRHAADGQAAGGGDRSGRVVAAPTAGARDDQHQVGGSCAAPDLGGDRARVVGLDAADHRAGAEVAGQQGQHERVGVDEVARTERRPDRPDLVPGRDDRHGRPARDVQR